MSRIPCLNLILIAKLTRGVSPYQVRRLIKEECSSSKGEGIVDGKKFSNKNEKAVIQEAVSSGTIDRRALLPELVS